MSFRYRELITVFSFVRSIESLKEEGECVDKFRSTAFKSVFCYTKEASEKRCFKGSITVSDLATGDVLSGYRRNDCPNEITLSTVVDGKVYTDISDNFEFLVIIGFLGCVVLLLAIIAGIQFHR